MLAHNNFRFLLLLFFYISSFFRTEPLYSATTNDGSVNTNEISAAKPKRLSQYENQFRAYHTNQINTLTDRASLLETGSNKGLANDFAKQKHQSILNALNARGNKPSNRQEQRKHMRSAVEANYREKEYNNRIKADKIGDQTKSRNPIKRVFAKLKIKKYNLRADNYLNRSQNVRSLDRSRIERKFVKMSTISSRPRSSRPRFFAR